ncbi:MAG: OmpA family protein, partial [Alphaproteobacteria bacterium]|nr:OmpA family protein [Alphaproteobacteria bacterium]
MQRLLAIAIVLGTALALSGVFASATHENDRPNSARIDAPDIRILETQRAATEMASEMATALAAVTGKFGIKPGAAKAATVQNGSAKPGIRMPAKIHFKPKPVTKPKAVTLGATGRKAARRVRAAGSGAKTAKKSAAGNGSKTIKKSPARIASARIAPAQTASASASASVSSSETSSTTVAVSGSAGSVGATRTANNDEATASAAPTVLRTPTDTCMGSSSAAGQSVDIGVSMATTWRDSNCILLKNARALLAQGNPKAAKNRLCMDDDNALAFEVVGEPCPRTLKSARLATEKLKKWNKGRTRSIAAIPTMTKSADTRTAIAPGGVRDFIANVGNRVLFGFDQSTVTPEAAKTLDKQAAWLKGHAQVTAVVEGHADSRGSDKYNLGLGERRAAAIRDYLIGKGVAASRVKTISYGETRPAAQGETETAWALNRRGVTFVLNADGKSRMTKLSAAPGPE